MIGLLKKSIPLWPSYKTKRKILVIESDDWGTIRTSSTSAYKNLLSKSYPLDSNAYCKNDALERNQDLGALLEVLDGIRNLHGASPKFTINYIPENPDFEKIRSHNYSEYFSLTSERQRKLYRDTDLLNILYEEGISRLLIRPQLHGREHLNVSRWMSGLRNKEKHLIDAFDHNMFSLRWNQPSPYPNEFMDALDFDTLEDLEFNTQRVKLGAESFKKEWGYYSKSFIAPCYIWSDEIETVLNSMNVSYLQGLKIQYYPKAVIGPHYNKKYHYTGQTNKIGQIYLVRNSFYEPSTYFNSDNVTSALAQIDFAFKHYTPAILSTHRVNYIGRIFEENRSRGLQGLHELLTAVTRKWPTVEFMFSDELGDLINSKQ